jgi:hypothetical protein
MEPWVSVRGMVTTQAAIATNPAATKLAVMEVVR